MKTGSELFDIYVVHGVTTDEIAAMDLDTLIAQTAELMTDDQAENKHRDVTEGPAQVAAAVLAHAVEDSLYGKETGYITAVTVLPGGKKDGSDYGPAVVKIVVLDNDGATVAYRLSTDAQDEDWALGDVEHAVDAGLEYWEQWTDRDNAPT